MQKISLIIFLFISATVVHAQDNKASNATPATAPATAQNEKSKNAVELMLEDAQKRGETIYGTCLENCGESPEHKSAEGLEKTRALRLPKPVYPTIARMAHASGEVQVKVILDTDGKVIAASAVSGHPLLHGACVTAAWDARFTPPKLNGQPVKVTGIIIYNFVN